MGGGGKRRGERLLEEGKRCVASPSLPFQGNFVFLAFVHCLSAYCIVQLLLFLHLIVFSSRYCLALLLFHFLFCFVPLAFICYSPFPYFSYIFFITCLRSPLLTCLLSLHLIVFFPLPVSPHVFVIFVKVSTPTLSAFSSCLS